MVVFFIFCWLFDLFLWRIFYCQKVVTEYSLDLHTRNEIHKTHTYAHAFMATRHKTHTTLADENAKTVKPPGGAVQELKLRFNFKSKTLMLNIKEIIGK